MDYAEAVEWLKGNRSMTNIIMDVELSDRQLTLVRIAQADAAMTKQAYYVVKAQQIKDW